MADRPKVVVLGGGFGGVGAVRKLAKADVDIVLVDKHDYHTFQPLLYQVATDLLDEETVGHPLPDLFHDQTNVAVRKASVSGVDFVKREVQVDGSDPLPYDYLVLALGATVNFFGVKGADEHAFPMYTLADALRLKEHVLERWEAADKDPALAADGALNVVVVGGGATGIETAGALIELYRNDLEKDYPAIKAEDARVILVEAGPELFPMFKAKLRTYAKKALEKRGVEVLLGEVVASIEPTRVNLKSGTVLNAHTLIWGAGLQANPLVKALGLGLEKGNRIAVGPDLTVPDHSEVFVVGDIAWITDSKTNEVLPQLGSVALQAGEHAGQNIARLADSNETEPFVYFDKGTMATIGRRAAVVQMPRGKTMTGTMASLAWGAVHLALLSTGEDRAKAVVDWTWAGLTHERVHRISVDTSEK